MDLRCAAGIENVLAGAEAMTASRAREYSGTHPLVHALLVAAALLLPPGAAQAQDVEEVLLSNLDYGDKVASVTVAPAARSGGICARTDAVREALVARIKAARDCSQVTAAHLAGLRGQFRLDGNGISSLKAGDFAGLSKLTEIWLDNNQLASLPSDLFDGLRALEILQLGGNQLDNLQSDVFDGLPALWFLDLSNNRLTRLSAGAFNGLQSLERLLLGGNRLSTLPMDVFDRLPALWFLDLEANQLTVLPAEVFDGLTALEELNLEANRLSALPAGLFDGLSSLTNLSLMENQLTSLPEDLFGGLSALTALRLDQNRLTSLPADLFEGLSSLTELTLMANQLSSLPEGVFDGLSSLQWISLPRNRLTTLPDGVFEGLSSLRILEVQDNPADPMVLTVSLQKVGDHGFKATAPAGAPFTMTLPVSVENGSIDGGAATLTIPAGAVHSGAVTVTRTAGTTAAVTADIGPSLPALPPRHLGYALARASGLPLEVLPEAPAPGICARTDAVREALVDMVKAARDCSQVTAAHLAGLRGQLRLDGNGISSLKAGDFAGLSKLTEIWLDNNQLASLPSDLFDGLPALEILQLGGNQLDNLQSDVFDGLPALWFLDLSNNRLTRLSAGAFNGLPALEKLVLGANPLSTLPVDVFDGLSALWFLDLEDLQLSALPAEVFDGLTALEELNLEANRLSALPAGVFDGLSSLTKLTLMANQLTSLPEDVFGGLSALTALRLDQNRLSSLPADLFEGLSSLQELWLHTNRLTSAGLPSDVFDGLSSLFRLVLRTNRLTTLPDGLFDGLSALTIIELYGNPVDPMVVAVSLEKVGNHGFKATAPAGAPFTMALPVSVTNGSIDGGAATLTIPAGAVESAPLTVTRTAGTAAGVTADIGPSLPALPPRHLGYALAKAPGLPLEVLPEPVSAPRIDGLPQVGNALEVSFAEPPAGALAYQWLRGSEVIDGAAARTYVPTVGDVGSRLSVRVDRGGVSITSPATAPVWPAPANPPLADGEEELLSATVTLGSHQFPFWVAGYGRIRGEPFGEMDVTSFEDGGAMYVIDAFFVNSRGVFGLAAGSTLPDASGLVAYWNGYRIPELEAHTGNGGKSPPMLMGPTPQPKTEYSRYEGGASDGIRVAVSLRRAGTTDTIIKDDELTARFEDLPAEHDGESAFTFRIAFSERVSWMNGRRLREDVVAVAGGRATSAGRVNRRRDLWELKVEPDSHEAVGVHLPETTDCATDGAVCTSDGRPLSHALSATVAGPAGLSVADAEADEAAGATMRFAVTLDRTAVRTVTVDWTTADGTARAGDDYAAAEGTLTFAPGERSKTVAVTVFDDSVDDGGETFGLLLSNPSGARLADAEGIGTIHNADPLPQVWLVRFSRTAADQAIDAIGERFENPGGDSHATFAGRRLWNGGGPPVSAGAGAGGSRRPFGTTGQHGTLETPGTGMTAGPRPASVQGGMANGGMHATGGYRPTLRDLLIGSSFRLSAGHAGGDGESRRLTAWGRASAAGFDGVSAGVSINGEVATFLLGADAAWNRWLAGVSVAHSVGAGAFRGIGGGELDSTLTAVHPYVRYRVTGRLTAWGVLGYGAGDLTLETAGSAWRTDTSMRMAAAGARGVFLGGGGLELAAKMDARVTHIGSGAAVGETGLLGAASGGTSRLRLLLEGSRSFGFGETRTLTPTLELGVRRDGGDAETGAGVDIGGSLRYVDAALGLTIDAGGRYLAAHEDDAYREWGASASIRIDPGTPGRGLTLAFAPSWGAAAAGGAERLWLLADARELADGGDAADAGLRLDANVGYGVGAFRGWGGMLPFAGLRLAGPGRDWRAGVKWTLGENAAFGFEATRRDSPMAPPGHGIVFQAALRW